MNSNSLEEYFSANEKLWNGLVSINKRSKMYDLDSFKKGKTSLNFIEIEELGDVSGKSLLHLQCHFGMDTLSWARLGARVTGVDFSEEAIQLAGSLSKELAIPARFVRSNIYDLSNVLKEKFDIVYTSYGVLCWLPDLAEWGRIIHNFLMEKGTFYIVEFHPIRSTFDDEGQMKEPYFHSDKPIRYEGTGTYADPSAPFYHVTYEWLHSMADVVNALVEAGLRIEFLHEFPFSVYDDCPWLVQRKDGLWYHKNKDIKAPLTFSIKARLWGRCLTI
ncbi:MAG: methyltransferase domain-containing protein [candidate division WOR-3 bacterium]|nr:MAG: methyltransferase domain-containing protein [candidate division WOR-3 bacterium]